MGVRIQVKRGDGDKQGPDIINSLIPTEVVAAERGRVFIDENSTHRNRVSVSTAFEFWTPLLSLVRIDDMHEEPQQGLCREVSLNLQRSEDSFQADIGFSLEVESGEVE